MKNSLSPIQILMYYLLILVLWASWGWGGTSLLFWVEQLRNFILLYGTGRAIYEVLLRQKLIRPTRDEHRAITSMILFLLFDPMMAWWVFPVVGGVTEVMQRVIRVPSGPVFNPAALGAFLLSFARLYPSWWGTNFSPRLLDEQMSVAMLLTLPVAGYVAHKYKKLPLALTAAIVFTVTFFIQYQEYPSFLLLDGTLAFFLLVMVIEPKTSPAIKQQQYWFGGAVGLLTALGLSWLWREPYTTALLISNLGFNLYRNQQFIQSKFARK